MNVYLEHKEVAKVWPKLKEIIGRDPSLIEALMRQVKVRPV
eukprot:CAMPEP_0203929854 /NCGR_PEP_ID=MMETSP0359-20131031/68702_1 /ASSEMBLY_ACC=CAM_ASM_000338 /TAXON_ID=268821 /ORGANISM="Scrippsiella Hangoei, Strain SHTV-5" /LENGTH=40 /DNA_ID= /DNA_START= /DNA_END= /DNA_ORIENTATION=